LFSLVSTALAVVCERRGISTVFVVAALVLHGYGAYNLARLI
jgi:hypothetical protein